jgi:hypothetical protein
MSLSATGGGNASGELMAAILQVLQSAQFTSSAGDSPKINKYIPGSVDSVDFGSVLDSAVTTAVLRHMEDNGLVAGPTESGGPSNESSITQGQAVGVARTGLSAAQNPTGLVMGALTLLPHAALVALALSLIPIIIGELTKPGGEFDLRWKRVVEKEFNALQDRQTAFDISVGERGTIFQARAGFLNTQGQSSNTNSLKLIREGGINKNFLTETDYVDHSKGFDI